MATDVLMPAMGYDMTEGTIVRWLKQPGDAVKRGDPLAEIETDKAVVEIEAFAEGTLAALLVSEGDVVPVGAPIARIGAEGEVAAPAQPAAQASAPATAATAPPPEQDAAQSPAAGAPEPPVTATAPEPAAAPSAVATAPAAPQQAAPASDGGPDGRLRISPVAARIAAERGIDPHTIQGTGPDGRILRRDVENAPAAAARPPAAPAAQPAAQPAPPPAPAATPAPASPAAAAGPPSTGLPTALPQHDTIFEPARMRQTMARRMAQSKGPAPHYYLTVDVDMTEAQALRNQVNESAKGEYRVSVNDLVSRAAVLALGKHPLFNATFTEDGQIKLNARVNLGLAVALPEGLIAPCVIDVGRASLIQLSQSSRDLAERARANRLRPDEYADGTFTISNLGMYGVDTLVAIINPPQTAILGVGRVIEKPVVRDGQVVVREMMTAALSADHRVTTGAEGAEFLRTIRETLENPVRLLV